MLTDTNLAGRKVRRPRPCMVACTRTAGACLTHRGMWTVERPRERTSAHFASLRCPLSRARAAGALLDRAALPREALAARFLAGRFLAGLFVAGPIVLPLTSACRICSRSLTAAGQVPPSGGERLADILEQGARESRLTAPCRSLSAVSAASIDARKRSSAALPACFARRVCGMSSPSSRCYVMVSTSVRKYIGIAMHLLRT